MDKMFERKKIIIYYIVLSLFIENEGYIENIYWILIFVNGFNWIYIEYIYIKNILVIKCIDFSDEGGFILLNICIGMCKLIINN